MLQKKVVMIGGLGGHDLRRWALYDSQNHFQFNFVQFSADSTANNSVVFLVLAQRGQASVNVWLLWFYLCGYEVVFDYIFKGCLFLRFKIFLKNYIFLS